MKHCYFYLGYRYVLQLIKSDKIICYLKMSSKKGKKDDFWVVVVYNFQKLNDSTCKFDTIFEINRYYPRLFVKDKKDFYCFCLTYSIFVAMVLNSRKTILLII